VERVPAPIQDHSRTQPVVAPGEISILNDSPEEPDSRRATQYSEKYENQEVDTGGANPLQSVRRGHTRTKSWKCGSTGYSDIFAPQLEHGRTPGSARTLSRSR
jgi:hypothetical protein